MDTTTPPPPPKPKVSIARGDVHYRKRAASASQPTSKDRDKDRERERERDRDTTPIPSPPSTASGKGGASSSNSGGSTSNRGFSGSLLARLSFRRDSASRDQRPASRDKDPASPTKALFRQKSVDDDDDVAITDVPDTTWREEEREAAMKQRKRTGSLRKAALLSGSGRRTIAEERPRLHDNTFSAPDTTHRPAIAAYREAFESPRPAHHDSDSLTPSHTVRRQFSYESTDSSTFPEAAAVTQARLALLTHQHHSSLSPSSPTSPLDPRSSISQTSFTTTATTSDDESLLSLPSITTSYFPPTPISSTSITTNTHRKPLAHHRSPLSRPSLAPITPPEPPPHSSATTETWGWLLLCTTWLTFTVGMGSSLEIWSWAWDVGDTPYAPPELEDDPTLPIVGYYPALMVLSGVVAWVWVTVAWIGMKYFRHAKIEV